MSNYAAAAMVMGNNGIRASEAGVALRSALVRMVKPTKDMQAVLARANIDIRDFVKGGRQITAQNIVESLATDGVNAKPFIGAIESALKDPSFARNLPGLTQRLVDIVGGGGAMDRSKLAENISDALTAAGSQVDLLGFVKALQNKGIDLGEIARIFDARQGARLITLLAGFKDLGQFLQQLQTEARGSTDRMAAIMQQGVVGAWARFAASIENLVQAIAKSGVLDTATGLLNKFAGGIEALSKASPALLSAGTYLAMIAAAAPGVALAGASLIGIIRAIVKSGVVLAGLAGVGTAGAGIGAGTAAGAGVAAGAAASRAGLLKRLLGPMALAWLAGDATNAAAEGTGLNHWIWSKTGLNMGATSLSDWTKEPGSDERTARIRAWLDSDATQGLQGPPAAMPGVAGKLGDAGGLAPVAPAVDYAPMVGQAGKAGGDAAQSFAAAATARLQAWAASLHLNVAVHPKIDLGGIHGDVGVGATR